MSKRRLVVAGLLAVLVLILAGILSQSRGWQGSAVSTLPIVETTTDEQREWMKSAFATHMKVVHREGEKVHFESDGFFRVVNAAAGTAVTTFTLAEGEEFQGGPDHHSHQTFRVQQVEDDGVTVEYESKFDHTSFGKNLTTIDRGIVKLAWSE